MKYVLITGACGGMGKATTKLFKDMGFTVFALDKIACDPEENVIPIVADLTQEKSIEDAYAQVSKTTNQLLAIIHFAGVYMMDSLVELSSENFDNIMKINVYGAYYINKTFLPMLSSGSKIMITTSELAPLDPLPFTGIYAITKSALDKYAYSLRMELQLLGISVSVLRAGAVKTNMLGASTSQLDNFCSKTNIYQCNAEKFKNIVNSVESKCIDPGKIALKTYKIVSKKKPKFAYAINRNPLLLLLNTLPKKMQCWIIKQVLK